MSQVPRMESVEIQIGSTKTLLSRVIGLAHARSARAYWLLCWAAILIAGLWPFSTQRHNQVKWLQTENGIHFGPDGIVSSTNSLADFLGGVATDAGFTMEILVRPQAQQVRTLQSIVAEDGPSKDPEFVLEQWGRLLLLRTFFGRAGHLTYRKLGIDDALVGGQLVHIAVVSGKSGTTIFVNGAPRDTYRDPIAVNKLSGRLLLGNSSHLSTAWTGDLLTIGTFVGERSAADISRDSLAWLARNPSKTGAIALFEFNEKAGETAHDEVSQANSLQVPKNLRILHRTLLKWDYKETLSGFEDVAVNVIGFVPFGLFGTLVLRRRLSLPTSVGAVILLGFACSLSIEFMQSYIPLRSSSSADVLMNSVGTAIGAMSVVVPFVGSRIPAEQR
jgi:VanZ family protein